ncbi:Fic family protein [Mannheimia pernigra]|uniref:Fic family protein n=1 Tax=Mannheimia pernigra TaxID=111844 RepID=UPI001CEF7A22|nr:Fic family protein [Mannheimia pernigra]
MIQAVDFFSFICKKRWKIHPFGEGNTRTTAVFLVKYLKMLGFKKLTVRCLPNIHSIS